MYRDLEHPEITRCLRTGYPSWKQERPEGDEDALYDERRDSELFDD